MTTAAQVTKKLEGWGAENVRQIYLRQGAERAYGVMLGKVRELAGTLGKDHALGLALWETEAHEARVLACMVMDPAALTKKEARALIASVHYPILCDELVSRLVSEAPFAKELGESLREGKGDFERRAGWKILAERVAAGNEADPKAILDVLERAMPDAPFRVKEGMNYCLVQIGTKVPTLTERAVAIGKKLGVWDTRPIPKGCTSAYAPEWIAMLLARKSPEWKARAAEAVAVRDAALKAAKAEAKGGSVAAPKSRETKVAPGSTSKKVASKRAPSARRGATEKATSEKPRAKSSASTGPMKKKESKPKGPQRGGK